MCAMRRFTTLFALLTFLLLLAVPAGAAELSGEGLYHGVDDRIVTNAGFIIIAAFPTLILLASLLQWQLDKRKERRKAATKARGASPHWNTGW